MRKEVKLDNTFGNEYSGKYVFSSISWAKSNDITSQCTQSNPLTKQTTIDLKKLQAMTLDAVMVDRPKAVTLEKLMCEGENGLPLPLGELLMAMCDRVNGYSSEDREQLKKLKAVWGLEG
jgi:hypothetical protein